jgi:hypothetical protein
MMPEVFINYAKDWLPAAKALHRMLRNAGCKPWLDECDLLPGIDWRSEIPRAIERADIFLACLSPDYLSSRGYRHAELRMAYEVLASVPEGTVYVIPLRLHPDADGPDQLVRYQWLDFFAWDAERRLVEAIETHTGASLAPPAHLFTWAARPAKLDDFPERLLRETQNQLVRAANLLTRLVHDEPLTRDATDSSRSRDLSRQCKGLLKETDLDIEISCVDACFHYIIHTNPTADRFLGMSHSSQWSGSQGISFSPWVQDAVGRVESGILTWEDSMSSDPDKEWASLAHSLNGYRRRTVVAFRKVRLPNDDCWIVMVEGHQSEYR